MHDMKILVIEDDLEAAAYMVKAFNEADIVTDHASDGDVGYHLATENSYDVMVIDRMLPKRDGLSIIRALREKPIDTPVLIIVRTGTGGRPGDRPAGRGDDYLPKPYAFSELLARGEVLGRRKGTRDNDTVYRVGDLELDRLAHEVHRAGQRITLQPREFRLLEYLMQHARQMVTRTMLLEMSGAITSIRRLTSSTFIYPDCDRRSRRASTRRSCARSAAPATFSRPTAEVRSEI